MSILRYFNLAIALTVMVDASTSASEPQELANNPFARPPSAVAMEIRNPVQADGSPAPLDLRATMVGTTDKLANVGGRVVRPGDEIQGYTLLQVFEDHAIFGRDSNRLAIYVKPHLVEDDDEPDEN